MSFNVGMPMLGLKRENAKGKHAGNLRRILDEAGTERYSATKSFDPAKSERNLHLGSYASGEEAYAAIMDEIDDYEVEYKKTSYRGRGLRSDATVAFALIIKPEGDWINKQPPEVQEQFFFDSYEVLCELGVLSGDAVRMRERHLDEASPHEHVIAMGYDEDGRLAGSRIVNLKTFKKLNRDYPKLMQKRGWEVNELKAYDAEAVKNMTPEEASEYKEQHRAKRERHHGLSANEYAAMKDAEQALEVAKQANEIRRNIEEEIAELEPKQKQAKKDIKEAEKKLRDAREADFQTYSLARDIEASMGMAKSARPLSEVVEELEQRYQEMDELSRRIATATERLSQKEQKANQLLGDLEEAKREQPSSKESWMLNWLREKVPKAYAACEKAYETFKKKTDLLRRRKLEVFSDLIELEQRQNAQEHYEKQ